MHSPTRGHTHTHMHTRIYHEHRLLRWYIYIYMCVYSIYIYVCTLYSTVVWSTLWPILRRANPAQPSGHIRVQVFPLTWTSKEHWQRFVIFMFCCIWAESSEAQMVELNNKRWTAEWLSLLPFDNPSKMSGQQHQPTHQRGAFVIVLFYHHLHSLSHAFYARSALGFRDFILILGAGRLGPTKPLTDWCQVSLNLFV